MNPYLKIVISALVASYISPKIGERFIRPELTETDGTINEGVFVVAQGVTTAGVFAAISTLLGGPKATTAGGGGAT